MSQDFDISYNYLYIIRDCISGSLSTIFAANSDLHAYEYHKVNYENAAKVNPNLSLDDFELIYLGRQDKVTGVIEPDYKLVDESTFTAYREQIKKERAQAIKEIQKNLQTKK